MCIKVIGIDFSTNDYRCGIAIAEINGNLCTISKVGSDEFFANTMICLINQASYLLWKQMQRLEEDFINTL